jgi:hypothetical protein
MVTMVAKEAAIVVTVAVKVETTVAAKEAVMKAAAKEVMKVVAEKVEAKAALKVAVMKVAAAKVEAIKLKLLLPILTMPILVSLGVTPAFAQQQSNDFTLTVNAVNVPWGQSNINIDLYGPYGSHQNTMISNGPSPSTSFTVSGSDIPINTIYKVCISASAIGFFLPHCESYTHGEADESVDISPN